MNLKKYNIMKKEEESFQIKENHKKKTYLHTEILKLILFSISYNFY